MAIIDVVIVVDAPRILRDYGTNNAAQTGMNYVPLGQQGEGRYYLYMIATWFDVQNQAESELDVFANAGDKIRWRMTSLSLDRTYQCFIKEFVINRGANYITQPAPKHESVTVPQIDTSVAALNTTKPKQIDDVYWETTVLQPGPVTYHTNFIVTGPGCDAGGGGGNGGNGNCGGYTYDPYINTRL
jgi:nematocidal protein AidA